jgi:putative transposase
MPKTIVLDNGPELNRNAMFQWSQQHGVKRHFIQPGKPTQIAVVESCNGRFRDLCLNQHYFVSIEDARTIVNRGCEHCNREKPHRSLGHQPPVLFEERVAQSSGKFSTD